MLIFDIECGTFGKPNPEKDILKFVGFYDMETNEKIMLEDNLKIKEMFSKHKIIIGFNSKRYDEVVLKRYGLLDSNHLHIDLFEIVDKRAQFLDLLNESKDLRSLAKKFNLTYQKGDIDYNILNKTSFSEEELKIIQEYLFIDLLITKELYEYLYNYFLPFKDYMSEYDKKTFRWLTTSISVYAYKVICYKLGLKEEYNDEIINESYKGGFVAEPEVNEEHGNIYCLDFASLYPHCFMQANLYSHSCDCCKEYEKWRGNEMFKLYGAYCSKKQGKIEKILKEFYNQRLEFKRNKDKREYVIKIIINSMYGISGSPKFKLLFNKNTAGDCTEIARTCVIFARKTFRDEGYKILYSDTDSVYLKDEFNDKDKLINIKNNMIKELKNNFLFKEDTFDMIIDYEIKHIWFFHSGEKKLKKQYIFVTNDDKIKIKGLPIIKSDGSKIGLLIFNKYMKQQIISGKICFELKDLQNWLNIELKENFNIIARRFKVWECNIYKNKNQLQAQISKKYGSGVHYLIPNKNYGVGKGIRYCTIDEYNIKGLNLNALILNKFWKEMSHFCDKTPDEIRLTKKKEKIQRNLSAWTNI